MSGKRDAIVVGAGAAGLACAASLAAAGRDVVVLEARDRPGGRILTLRLDEERPVEVGAQVIHGERAATWDVVRAAGLPVEPLRTDEVFTLTSGGRCYAPAELERGGVALPWVVEQLVIAGVACPNGPPLQRALSTAWLTQVWCADPRRLSGAGMRAVRADWRAGLENFVLPAGYDGVVAGLAHGLDVRCSAAAGTIAWRRLGEVTVTTAVGRWAAPAVVVTVPPSVVAAGGLAFDPPLPEWKLDACRRIPVGDAISVASELSAPAAMSGWALAADDPAAFWRVRAGSRILFGSFKGLAAAAARALGVESPQLLEAAATCFPWLRGVPRRPTAVVDWGLDAWSRGGYCYPTADAAAARAAWARPVARALFFAGDATPTRHPATVHGAIESGLRAAGEVGELW